MTNVKVCEYFLHVGSTYDHKKLYKCRISHMVLLFRIYMWKWSICEWLVLNDLWRIWGDINPTDIIGSDLRHMRCTKLNLSRNWFFYSLYHFFFSSKQNLESHTYSTLYNLVFKATLSQSMYYAKWYLYIVLYSNS